MPTWGTEEDSFRSGHSVYVTLLAEFTSVDGYAVTLQLRIPPTDGWPDGEDESNPRRYAKGMCFAIWG